MGKLAVFKYLSFLMLITTIIASGFTFFGLFGGNVPPGVEHEDVVGGCKVETQATGFQ